MIVAVTGASGHLGGYVVPHLRAAGHEVIPVARTVPLGMHADVMLHLAGPRDWRDEAQVEALESFNRQVILWRTEHPKARVVAAGSWWQYAGPEAEALSYTRMKAHQQSWADVTVVLFSIYGDRAQEGRGFVPHLIDAVRSGVTLPEAGRELREWLHAEDAARAMEAALTAPSGVYEAASWCVYSPAALAVACGQGYLPARSEHPSAHPFHRYRSVPGWAARVDVLTHIRNTLAREAA